VTLLLHNLHCLQILKRITFRLAVLAYHCQNGLSPQYLADDLHQVVEVESRRWLGSAATAALIVPATEIALSLLLPLSGVISVPSGFLKAS